MVITVVVILAVLVVAAAVAGYFIERRRRERYLRETFGGEYDRAIGETGDRNQAERELSARQKRHEQLDIRPLDPQRAQHYHQEWEALQASFVDRPEQAVQDADMLIEALMGERGYPVGDYDTKVADLSVRHSDVLQHYRAAHEIAMTTRAGESDTEALRRAMVHYRALFAGLLDDGVEQREQAETSRRTR